MARRSDHSREELREMAITAAEQIVVEQGYEGLSARKVATAIGYTVGTLYLVFENLDDLILHINARTLDRLHAHMNESQLHCGDASDCLLQLGQVYIRFADEDPHRWAMVFEHRFSEDQVVPAWFQEKIARMFALVEKGLGTGVFSCCPRSALANEAPAAATGALRVCMYGWYISSLSVSGQFTDYT